MYHIPQKLYGCQSFFQIHQKSYQIHFIGLTKLQKLLERKTGATFLISVDPTGRR